MTDIVEKLRVAAFEQADSETCFLLRDAADDIERLRNEIHLIPLAVRRPNVVPFEEMFPNMASRDLSGFGMMF